jgi:hypothetical protein
MDKAKTKSLPVGRPETAGKEQATPLLKRKPGPPGVYKVTPGVALSTGGTDHSRPARQAQTRPRRQGARRHHDLAAAALIEPAKEVMCC